MPNWCSSFISIEGSKKNISKIKRMIALVGDDKGLFQTLTGRDETLTEQQYESGAWYDSNINRWGCKWDLNKDDTTIDMYDESISINCSTAWSPPTGFCKLVQEIYDVKVRCEYEESGCDFAGYYEVSEDGEVDEQTWSYLEGIYHLDQDNFWHEMESQIEWNVEEERDVEEFLKEFPFLDEKELQELREMYEKELENSK